MFLFFINELPEVVKNLHDNEIEGTNNEEEVEVTNDVIVYADDNTPITADREPLPLQEKAQTLVDSVTDWFARNKMICSSEKTKLLIVGTLANRNNKLAHQNVSLRIRVCGEVKDESTSEKLLGVIVNNTELQHNTCSVLQALSVYTSVLHSSPLRKYTQYLALRNRCTTITDYLDMLDQLTNQTPG